MTATGWHFDGATATRYPVRINAEGNSLVLTKTGEQAERIDPARLIAIEVRKDVSVYGLDGVDGWRLGLAGGQDPDVDDLLPGAATYGGLIDRLGMKKFAGIAAILSTAVLILLWLAPGWVAPLIPQETERRIGDALFADMETERICRTEEGQAALAALTDRLAPGVHVDVRVADIGMANAVTLPGGRILIFKGLIRQSDSADELAGVLAHEIAHYREHHVMEAVIRQLGLSLIIGSFGGDAGATLTQLAGLSFSRDAEREADARAIAYLTEAGISPAPTAGFFRRMAKAEKMVDKRVVRAASFLSTHPISSERAERFTKAAEGGTFTPATSAADWQAIRTLCPADDEEDAAE